MLEDIVCNSGQVLLFINKMCLKVVLLISMIWMLTVSSVSGPGVELGYYWLDYNGGNMSEHALLLGSQSEGLYVGQVHTKEYELLPAVIQTSKPYATSSADRKAFTRNEYIKVLCSQFPRYFKWIPTNAETFSSIPDLILGGTRLGKKIYIGKYFHNGKIRLGKEINGIYFPDNDKEAHVNDNFSALVYRIGE